MSHISENFYAFRCLHDNHRGGGFVMDVRKKETQPFIRYQQDVDHPRFEVFKNGRIDTQADYINKQISCEQFESLIQHVDQLVLPALPPLTGGFDGVTYSLWIENGMSSVQFSWWLDCPEVWLPVQMLWHMINDMME